jgi:hypothetical protein
MTKRSAASYKLKRAKHCKTIPNWKLVGEIYSPIVYEGVLCNRCKNKIDKHCKQEIEELWENLNLPQSLEDTNLKELMAVLPFEPLDIPKLPETSSELSVPKERVPLSPPTKISFEHIKEIIE